MLCFPKMRCWGCWRSAIVWRRSYQVEFRVEFFFRKPGIFQKNMRKVWSSLVILSQTILGSHQWKWIIMILYAVYDYSNLLLSSFFGVRARTIGFQTQIRCIRFENCPNFQLKMGIFVATVASHGDWPSLVMQLFHSWVAVLCPSESFSCSLVHEKRGDALSSQWFWEKISVPSRNPSAKHGSNTLW